MVNIKEELTSGQFSIYGQCVGLLSAVFLLLFGLLNFFSSLIVFSIVAFVFCGVVILLEIPLFVRIVPGGPQIQTYIDYFENHYFRAALYLGGALVIFLSNLVYSSSLNVAGVALFTSAVCYGVAGVKGQPRTTSALTGGTGASGEVNGQESLA